MFLGDDKRVTHEDHPDCPRLLLFATQVGADHSRCAGYSRGWEVALPTPLLYKVFREIFFQPKDLAQFFLFVPRQRRGAVEHRRPEEDMQLAQQRVVVLPDIDLHTSARCAFCVRASVWVCGGNRRH